MTPKCTLRINEYKYETIDPSNTKSNECVSRDQIPLHTCSDDCLCNIQYADSSTSDDEDDP
jgi:hypothetical protein